jgi:uncharacterized protein (TIGR03118 family)
MRIVTALLAATASCGLAMAQSAGIYTETPVISDQPIAGAPSTLTVDSGFVDPWGVSGGNTLWINTNVTGFSYVTSVAGVLSTTIKAVVPPASGTGTGQPTGTVQNPGTGFILSNNTKASFLFSTADGTISGWNSATTANHALIEINNSSKNAVYTDLAVITNTTGANVGTFLLVPNFGQGADVEVYNSTFQPAPLTGTFTDPNIPTGYAPYGIKVVGTQVFVTYMLRTTPPFAAGAGTYQEILGTNTGFVSVFDFNGNFIARAVTGGNLNAPWGVTLAPANFGIYGGALLIGNFGDGLITAYNPTTYAYLGTIADGTGKPIAYPGLWEIFVSTATAAIPNAIYFTAGLDQETHGLFGYIANGATTTGPQTFNVSASSQVATIASVGSSAQVTVSVAPTNGFTGMVSLSCSGLPGGATCNFASPQLTVTPSAPATEVVTISTSTSYGKLYLPGFGGNVAGIASALLLPLGSLLLYRRKRFAGLRVLGGVLILCGSAGLVSGCSSSSKATPTGMSNVVITATSGSVSQTTTVALTIQ